MPTFLVLGAFHFYFKHLNLVATNIDQRKIEKVTMDYVFTALNIGRKA